jgi:transcriptional regulator with XRE-family HTH domain
MTMAMPGVRRPFVPTEGERRIAQLLKESRARRRLTQTEVAKRIGVTARTLVRYEKLERSIPTGHLLGLQEILGPLGPSQSVLGASPLVSELRIADGATAYQGEAEVEPSGPEERLLLNLFRGLPPRDRMAILGYATKLIARTPLRNPPK